MLELLVVVVIIGLLASYVAPRFLGQVGRAEREVARAQLEALAKAVDTYRLDTGVYPDEKLGLVSLIKPPAGLGRWAGPYLQKAVPLDPWGNAYVYRMSRGLPELLSFGRDGLPGGSGEDADLSSASP